MKICPSGMHVIYKCVSPACDLQDVIWGSFGALFPKLGHNSKTAYCRAKRTKNLDLLGLGSMYFGIFDLVQVKVIWGHSMHFSQKWG